MPTATKQQQQDQPEAMAEATPDLVSKVPSNVPKKPKQPTVVSRSRRPALGGVVTSIVLHPDGTYHVDDVPDKEPREFTKFAAALRFARTGESPEPQEQEEGEAA
jgi:hypothetical protein